MRTKFLLESLKERDHSEDLGVDWRIILKCNLALIILEVVYWTHLAQDRDQWRALVNTVMNLRVQSKALNFLTSYAYYQLVKKDSVHEVGSFLHQR
jgi:hypothetical protein